MYFHCCRKKQFHAAQGVLCLSFSYGNDFNTSGAAASDHLASYFEKYALSRSQNISSERDGSLRGCDTIGSERRRKDGKKDRVVRCRRGRFIGALVSSRAACRAGDHAGDLVLCVQEMGRKRSFMRFGMGW